jgi:two-component system LytT family response regulator
MTDLPLRAVVVDDESLARRRVARLLAQEPDVEVVATAGDGISGAEAVAREQPDLVFLDVQMPGADGFEALRRFRDALREAGRAIPVVIFATAFDEHAARAFDERALDYLVKPFKPERFRESVARAREHLQRERLAEHHQRLDALLDGRLAGGAGEVRRFVYKDGSHYGLLDPEEIAWAEAQDVYVNLHTARGEILVREPLYSIEERLGGAPFVRTHRSYIVNVDHVARVVPGAQGRATLHLDGGGEVPMSRSYRERVLEVIRDGMGGAL